MQFHTWKDFELLHKWKMLQNVHVSSVAFPLHSSVGAPVFCSFSFSSSNLKWEKIAIFQWYPYTSRVSVYIVVMQSTEIAMYRKMCELYEVWYMAAGF